MASMLESNGFYLILLAFLGLCASRAASSRMLPEPPSVSERYAQWMATYGRVYVNDAERETRFSIFKSNLEFVESFNKGGNKTYKLAINEFADMTNEEFRAYWDGYKISSDSRLYRKLPFKYENVTAIPSDIDWRKRGAVTPVKNQGKCGVDFLRLANYVEFFHFFGFFFLSRYLVARNAS